MTNDDGFTSFACEKCHTEIEASLDMIGEETECPACGARIVVPGPEKTDPPSADGVVRHGEGEASRTMAQAQKSRTIRIELGDL